MTPRRVVRIARWEALSGASGFDRRTVALAAVSIVALAALLPAAAAFGTAPDAGLYRAGVAPSSPYYEPLAADPTFAVRPPDAAAYERGDLDLLIREGRIRARDTRKGRAAAAALASAVERYNDRLMARQPDQVAAFPVTVQLRYVERDVIRIGDRTGDGDDGEGDAGDGSDGSGGGRESGGEGTTTATATPTPDEGAGGALGGLPSFGGTSAFLGETTGTPSEITPPFPFGSLVLAFAFVVPMNFVIQAYASSVLHERTNRRGEPLLVSPASRAEIIAGKTLPYFLAMLAVAALTALAIGGGAVSILAVLPIMLLFLASAFVGALLARSHKELTFVLVTVSVAVTTYVFVPAIFTDIHPIAAISPLTLVVRELEGVAVAPGTIAFSTVPVYVAAGVLFALGAGMYREEDLFARRPLPAKLLDALANPIRGRHSAALLSVLVIPFVFLAELLAVATLFVLPLAVSLPALLVSIAAIEEVAKSLHVYAGFERGRYDRALRPAAVVGALSGAGFFLGEKVALAAQLVGLARLDLGRAAFELGAGVGGASGGLLAALLLVPLALHAVTAGIASLGASRGRRWYLLGLIAAILLHTGYNLAVVVRLG